MRDSSRFPRRRPFIYLKPPYAIGSESRVYRVTQSRTRWRSLPRVRRHRASPPQDSSERVLPWQVTMDQLICAFLSHAHYTTIGMKWAWESISGVTAMGTQWHDPINSGLTRWRMAVKINKWTPPRKSGGIP